MEGLEAVIEAGQANGSPKQVGDGIPYAIVPDGASLKDLERLLPAPKRLRASVVAHSVEAFAEYFKRFATTNSLIFADQERVTVTAVLDYDGPGEPSFREHTVTYTAPLSREWQTWRGVDGRSMSQADFTRFIEDNRIDIRSPAGADMMEIASSLRATRKVEFSSDTKLGNGDTQLTYNETTEGVTKRGSLAIPDEFTLGIPAFRNGPLYEVTARLRYRIADGKLAMWFDLYRWQNVLDAAFTDVTTKVQELTGSNVLIAVPPI